MRHLTPEHKAKISKSMKGGNSTSFKKGVSTWNKGKKWSEETREKMRQAKLRNPVRYWKGKKRLDMAGANNHNYGKFGKEHSKWTEKKKRPFHKSIRNTFEYKQWRSNIFIRDKYTCVLCGVVGGILNVDHYPKRFIDIINESKIKTFDDVIECKELWDMNNGRTLCLRCHRNTDTWGQTKKLD